MRIIGTMDTKGLIRIYFRTTERLRAELKRLVIDIGAAPTFSRRRRMLSQETIANASWLMMRDMDPAELAERLAPYIAQVEATFAEDDAAVEAEDKKKNARSEFGPIGKRVAGDPPSSESPPKRKRG